MVKDKGDYPTCYHAWMNILMSNGAQFLNRNDPPPKGTCEHTWKRSGFGIGFHEANGIEKGTSPKGRTGKVNHI